MLPLTPSRVPTSGLIQIGLLLTITALLTGGVIPVQEFGTTERSHASLAEATQLSSGVPTASAPVASILFLGDVLLARDVERHQQRYGYAYPFAGLRFSDVAPEPYVFANFEAAIPQVHQPTPNMSTRFSVAPTALPALRAAGVSHVSLANNHSFDFGSDGYQHTRDMLAQNGITPFGHPSDLSAADVQYIALSSGQTVGVVGINAVFTTVSAQTLQTLMESVESRSDLQIAYIHWGTEYRTQHDETQQKLASMLVGAGFDLIIGHHPHVVQDIDLIAGVPVVYSLGNHIFDQYFSTAVQEGLMVSLQATESFTLTLHPVTSVASRAQPQVQDATARADFLVEVARRSHPALRDQILAGQLTVLTPLAHTTKTAMMVE